ncbi:MAG: hypothetical protein P8170_06180 [Gemmatimonadota bacterium]
MNRPLHPGLEPDDSTDVLGRARREQSRFERRRIPYLRSTFAGRGGSCDEIVGRFCTWYDEGDWVPEPEAPEIVELRADLLVYLDSVQALLPGDAWLLGQRVWYQSEGGRWGEALRTARACGRVVSWWCGALEGFALHGLGRFVEAERRFREALDDMEPDQAAAWRTPRRAVDGDARDLLDEEGEAGSHALRALWMLGDPLYLVPGNDRVTEHYARWTVSTIRERARNPFQIRWARDLEELTIRHGWELGWERDRDRPMDRSAGNGVVGHKHPDGRDFLPPGSVLADPAGARAEDLVPDRSRPRSLYAPSYAPVLLPMGGQVAVFPRGDRFTVVATYFVPPDTTWHARHERERPWMDAGRDAGVPDQAAVFLVSAEQGRDFQSARAAGGVPGAALVAAPSGAYVLSVEAWSPSRRIAGRYRSGLRQDTVPPDVATLSGLLLVRGGGPEPRSLDAAAEQVLIRPEITRGETLGVVWELGGVGWRPETITYRLTVDRADRGVVRRLGERLGIVGPDQSLALSWEEPGPDRPGGQLRWADLELPPLEDGAYRVRLEADLPGRTALRSESIFSVR